MTGKFYVYQYSDPDTGVPFYVGKGCSRRAQDGLSAYSIRNCRNALKTAAILRIKESGKAPLITYLEIGLSEQQALDRERFFIDGLGRRVDGTGPLTNLTMGGDGTLGRPKSQEVKDKIRQSNLGKTRSAEAREAVSKAAKARWANMSETDRLHKISTWRNGRYAATITS